MGLQVDNQGVWRKVPSSRRSWCLALPFACLTAAALLASYISRGSNSVAPYVVPALYALHNSCPYLL